MTSTVFSKLIEAHPASEALLAWLQGPEGGLLKVRDNRKNPDDSLVMIYYNKDSKLDLPHVPYFRSVVWDMRLNRPVCAAPARAVDEEVSESFVVEEFVDGVMLNMFWDKHGWRMASRSQLDAGNTFYSRKPFLDLFMDAVEANGLVLNNLDKELTYSWVLQHPLERIVVPVPYGIPRVSLVQLAEARSMRVIPNPEDFLPEKFVSLLPKRHALSSLADVKSRLSAWGKQFNYKFKGLMVKDTATDRRWRFTTPEYELALKLRGNNSKLPYVWLERWSEKKLNQYLTLYPEDYHYATFTVDAFKACTQEAYDMYQKVYKKREFPLGQAPQKYRKLLWDIHEARAGSYFGNLQEFMNKQDTARKLWLVNYEVRYPPTQVPSEVPSEVPSQVPSDEALNQLADELEGQAAVAEQDEQAQLV